MLEYSYAENARTSSQGLLDSVWGIGEQANMQHHAAYTPPYDRAPNKIAVKAVPNNLIEDLMRQLPSVMTEMTMTRDDNG